MPLPERRKGETHKEFVDRCMGDEVVIREFPDAAQRRAVCERQVKAQAAEPLNFFSEPGSLTIEAAGDDGSGTPRLPRFTMLAYTGGQMRIAAKTRALRRE